VFLLKRDFLFYNVVQVVSCLFIVDDGRKRKISSQLGEIYSSTGKLHGDPLCLKDGALVEPLHTNFHQKKVGGSSFHMGLDIKRLVMGVFVYQTGCNRLALFGAYLSREAWPIRA
jgi:hypothetical protein